MVVTDVRVEWSGDEISEADALAEGVMWTPLAAAGTVVYHVDPYPTPHVYDSAVACYDALWTYIYGPEPQWRWVYEWQEVRRG
jgi:hypothetical protein